MKANNTISANLKGMAKHTYNRLMSAMAEDNDRYMGHTFAALTEGAKAIALQSGKFSNLYIRGERKGMAAEEAAKELTERAAAITKRKLRKIDTICAVAFLAEYISRQRKEDETPETPNPENNTPSTMNANEPELTAEQAAYYNAMLTPSDESASLAWESEPKTNEELTALGVDAFGDNENANEIDANHISESISRLRYELQEYHNNASKGGANRQRNMAMLAEDIARLEASANEITVTVSVTDNGNKCEYTANGKVLAAITYSKEFDAYDVNTPTVGYMTTDVTEAHKACESGIAWLLEQSGRKAAFDYSSVEKYNAEHYHNAIA